MGNSITAQYWISNKEESIAAAFLLERDYIIYKLHCGEAVPAAGGNLPDEKSVKKVPEPLKVGDRAFLNSGSPELTLTNVYPLYDFTTTIPMAEGVWYDATVRGVKSIVAPVVCFRRSN